MVQSLTLQQPMGKGVLAWELQWGQACSRFPKDRPGLEEATRKGHREGSVVLADLLGDKPLSSRGDVIRPRFPL